MESIDPNGPFGAKEAGQGPLLPVIPAVANAVADALGVRIDETPITPAKVLAALSDRPKGGPGRVGPKAIPAITFKDPIRVELPPGWRDQVLVEVMTRVYVARARGELAGLPAEEPPTYV